MELLALLLSFCIVFLGLLLIMGISITNIEVFNDAKYEADSQAQYTDFGNEGDSISHWLYTFFELTGQRIPFLPFDKFYTSSDNFDTFSAQLNDPQYSEASDTQPYEFNDYTTAELKIADNFPTAMPGNYREAANLLRGSTNNYTEEERVFTISDRNYFNRQETYDAFKKILGTNLNKSFNLETNRSNTVYMPAMKVLDK